MRLVPWIAALALGTAAAVHADPSSRALPQAAAEHVLDTADGPVRLADLDGEVVVVNFWATWCKPCVKEMPLLEALHARLQERGGRVLAVSVDRDPEAVARYIEREGLRLPVAVDGPDGLARMLDLPALPYTIVLDRSGRVGFAGPGGEGEPWTHMETALRTVLDRTPGDRAEVSATGDGR